MRKPVEVQLKYKDDENIISFLVDPVSDASYLWQCCRTGTAIWEELNSPNRNTLIVNKNSRISPGDKYRCLILFNNKVRFFSNTITIGQQRQKQAKGSSQERAYQYGSADPSVADTDGMDGLEFEEYCAAVLRKNGYYDVQVTQGSGDYGIDILAKKDSISYAIQCKCYSNVVGNKAVQEAYSGKAFYNCMVAVVLTNNYFTEAAVETARRNSVVLWDRDYLDMMIKNPSGEKKQQEHGQQHQSTHTFGDEHDFFKGCSSWEQVRERYKKLMQMYHPDHDAGDEDYAKAINNQYEILKKKFGQ